MPLYSITAYDTCTLGEPRVGEILVHAKDAERARTLAVEHLVKNERYNEIAAYANPEMSEVNRVPSRYREGVYDVHLHHCSDHM